MSNSVILAFAAAIKKFEGWFPGSWSYETNNPGNLTDTHFTGTIGTKVNPASGITFAVFDTPENGWNALVTKVSNAFSGLSKVYHPAMTISEFFGKYSGDQNEAQAVADALGVDPSTTLDQLNQISTDGGFQA